MVKERNKIVINSKDYSIEDSELISEEVYNYILREHPLDLKEKSKVYYLINELTTNALSYSQDNNFEVSAKIRDNTLILNLRNKASKENVTRIKNELCSTSNSTKCNITKKNYLNFSFGIYSLIHSLRAKLNFKSIPTDSTNTYFIFFRVTMPIL